MSHFFNHCAFGLFIWYIYTFYIEVIDMLLFDWPLYFFFCLFPLFLVSHFSFLAFLYIINILLTRDVLTQAFVTWTLLTRNISIFTHITNCWSQALVSAKTLPVNNELNTFRYFILNYFSNFESSTLNFFRYSCSRY